MPGMIFQVLEFLAFLFVKSRKDQPEPVRGKPPKFIKRKPREWGMAETILNLF